jgi:hypothetical protein
MIGNKNAIITWLLEQEDNLYEINKVKKKRSINANSYCWLLINKISEVLKTSKEEIYIEMLKKYGQQILIPTKPNQKPDGYFKYYEYYDKGKLNGKECDWYKVYKGSSQYDSKEMSILIDGIVSEARELGIMTLDEMEIERMVNEW